ncbi:hypothetical protein H4R33_000897 [Dimargaris cristalligena]|nr:hypothetical protein H4R33_000897 [Dimargaris cristalligena]
MDTRLKNEIHITKHGKIGNFVDYAERLFQSTEPAYTSVTIKAEGPAIIKAITVSEIIKRNSKAFLFQYNLIGNTATAPTQSQSAKPKSQTQAKSATPTVLVPTIEIVLDQQLQPLLESHT